MFLFLFVCYYIHLHTVFFKRLNVRYVVLRQYNLLFDGESNFDKYVQLTLIKSINIYIMTLRTKANIPILQQDIKWLARNNDQNEPKIFLYTVRVSHNNGYSLH